MSPCRTLEGLNGKMCEQLHTSLVVQKMQGGRAMFGTKRPQPLTGQGPSAPPSRVIRVSLLIEHDGLIHFDERPLDHRLRQSVPLQYLIIKPHQHFELCERRLPKVLV